MIGNVHKNWEELYNAFLKILERFPPNIVSNLSKDDILNNEVILETEFTTVYLHCFAIARDKFIIKFVGPLHEYPFYGQNDLDEYAFDIIEQLCDRDDDGLRLIVHIFHALLKRNPDPKQKDVYFYLQGVVKNYVNKYNEKLANLYDPYLINTGENVKSYIKRSGRYYKKGKFIYDSYVELDLTKKRYPSVEDLIRMCGNYSPQPKSAPQAVNMIFDLLCNNPLLRSGVEIRTLTKAAHEILKPVIYYPYDIPLHYDMLDDKIIESMIKAKEKTMRELRAHHSWRNKYSGVIKSGLFNAAEDYIDDLVTGKKWKHHYEYIVFHLPQYSKYEIRIQFLGSYQHLISKALGIMGEILSAEW